MSTIRTLALLALAACGGKGPDMRTKPHDPNQEPLAAAMASVCAAPTRAEHDERFGDPGARDAVLDEHLSDGVTHKEVLERIETWRSDQMPADKKLAELQALVQRAGLVTPCKLVAVWSDPDWGASEVPDAPMPEEL